MHVGTFIAAGPVAKLCAGRRRGEMEDVRHGILRAAAFVDWSRQGFRSTNRNRSGEAERPDHGEPPLAPPLMLRLPHVAGLWRHRSAILHAMSRKDGADINTSECWGMDCQATHDRGETAAVRHGAEHGQLPPPACEGAVLAQRGSGGGAGRAEEIPELRLILGCCEERGRRGWPDCDESCC